MTVRVGLVGAGIMGGYHARILAREIAGAELVAISDPDKERAEAASQGARIEADAMRLIALADVDAVVIATPDEFHHRLVLAAVDAGKPVLCEKPLAATTAECRNIVAAERGRKLVTTGYMRRFDPAYRELKQCVESGAIGEIKLMHCVHRNVAAAPWFTGAMSFTNGLVHELDICRWLLGVEYRRATVHVIQSSVDPIFVVLETDQGFLVTVEFFVNAHYGYDVHADIVGSKGTISMAEPALTRLRQDGAVRASYSAKWIPRFAEAYKAQSQAWIDGIRAQSFPVDAASAEDGLFATAYAEQLASLLGSGGRGELGLPV